VSESPTQKNRSGQRRGQRTKQQLVETTKALLIEQDIQSLTLEQISDRVGVSKSSILWHFDSKEALLTEAVLSFLDDIHERIAPASCPAVDVDDRAEIIFQAVSAYFTQQPNAKGVVLSLIFNKKLPPSVKSRIQEHWQLDCQRIRVFLAAKGADVELDFATSILELIHGSYIRWFLNGYQDDFENLLVKSYRALRCYK